MNAAMAAEPSIDDAVLYARDARGIVTLTLNRPDKRNALDDALMGGLIAALVRVNDDPDARCVVLRSAHATVFSAGGNLGGFAAEETVLTKHIRNGTMGGFVQLMGQLKVPAICALSGHALAGGLGLVLACDMVVAKAGVRIGTPEVNVGVFPFMLSALLQRNIPRKRVAELCFMGEQMPIEEAQALGIVNTVVPAEAFEATVEAWAAKVAAKSPLLLRLGKQALFEQQDMPLLQAIGLLRHYLTLVQTTSDVKEGVAAFMEKRSPVWKGE
jgi:enoyl-CoA hydratase